MESQRPIRIKNERRKKAPPSRGLYVLFLIFILLGQSSYAKITPSVKNKSSQNLIDETSPAIPGLPIRLKIPKIKVNAVIESVGLTSDGSMGIPKLPRNAAWYDDGPRPGEIGSATISGHLNWYKGVTGVFARLNQLKTGDSITVQDDTGKIISFIVRTIRLYGSDEDATDVFTSDDGKAHLNLITCDGVWDKKTKQYSKRLVVFTDKLQLK